MAHGEQEAKSGGSGLRALVVKGGAYLVARRAISLAMSLAGLVILTRVLGPATYGLYAAATGIAVFMTFLAQVGIEIYLVRHEGELSRREYDQAFSLLLALGAVAATAVLLTLPLLEDWLDLPGFGPVAAVVFTGLPLTVMTTVPTAMLERALDYRRVAWIELLSDASYYTTAVAFALAGAGVWALVIGWWARQVFQVTALHAVTRYRPSLAWDWTWVKGAVGYGLSLNGSRWMWEARTLVNPLIVGRFAGADAVGIIALTTRAVETLGFVRDSAFRLSIAAFGRVQDDVKKLNASLREGALLEVYAIGLPFVAFALLAPWLVPVLLGASWGQIIEIFPFVAFAFLIDSIFSLSSSALYVIKKNWLVTLSTAVGLLIFAGAALVLVPAMGIVGYGWALIFECASFALAYWLTVREFGPLDFRGVLLVAAGFSLTLFWGQLGWWAILGASVVPFLPQTRHVYRILAEGLKRRGEQPAEAPGQFP